MIVLVLADTTVRGHIRMARYRGSPEDVEQIFRRFVEELRRPGVAGGGEMFHHRNNFLFTPVDEVLGTGIADALGIPAHGPHQVEGSVGPLAYAGIPHNSLLPHQGFHNGFPAVHGRPVVAVVTICHKQACVLAGIVKIGEHIGLLFLLVRHPHFHLAGFAVVPGIIRDICQNGFGRPGRYLHDAAQLAGQGLRHQFRIR